MATDDHPLAGRILRKSDVLATREVAGEVIVVPIRGKLAQLKQIFVLNPVGAFIWEKIDGVRDLGSIQRGIMQTFEVSSAEAEADLRAYVKELEGAGLVVEAEAPSP